MVKRIIEGDHEKRKLKAENDEQGMGEFEDMWNDDDMDEGEVVIANDEDDEEMDQELQDDDAEVQEDNTEVYLPGGEMGEDEELVADQSTYEMLHSMNMEWPCLSFDILQDKLGSGRINFPLSSYIVAGSQADEFSKNKVYVMKMSSLHKTKHDEDEDGSDDEDDEDEDPVLEYKLISHEGGVNRIRVMPHPEVHIVATMAETGKVHIFDVTQQVASFDTPGLIPPSDPKPIHTILNHGNCEGYGIDWSPTQIGCLLTGDGKGRIYHTKKTETTFVTDKQAFSGHTSSIEDIQWSPSQGSVFATCSADQTVKIWDLRTKTKPQLSVHAHDTDVNVISWNKNVDYLLASGSDSGAFSIWDLRTWPTSKGKTPDTAAAFHWHRGPITSIDWHPIESSVLAVSGADDQLTLWDLALERDAEEEAIMGKTSDGNPIEVPPQLLFIHQGQKHIKEIHWHRQIPGVILSTAYDGFNVFKTINS